jgi:hypothetical protein
LGHLVQYFFPFLLYFLFYKILSFTN